MLLPGYTCHPSDGVHHRGMSNHTQDIEVPGAIAIRITEGEVQGKILSQLID